MKTWKLVSVSMGKSNGKGSNIVLIILFGLTSLVGFMGYGSFSDLAIWFVWCMINTAIAFVCLISKDKKQE